MNLTKTTINSNVEILASKDFTAIPVNVTRATEYNNDTVILTGTPLTFSDEFYSGAGILLYDVYPAENPNAALVVAGVIDAKKAQNYANVEYTSEIMAAMPAITFRFDIGVYADDSEG